MSSLGGNVDRLEELLEDARRAIERMPQDALGRDPKEGYFYRDELLHRINDALNPSKSEVWDE